METLFGNLYIVINYLHVHESNLKYPYYYLNNSTYPSSTAMIQTLSVHLHLIILVHFSISKLLFIIAY